MGRTRRRAVFLSRIRSIVRRQNRRRYQFDGPVDAVLADGSLVVRGAECVTRNSAGHICISFRDPDYVISPGRYRPRAWHQPSPLRPGLIKGRR